MSSHATDPFNYVRSWNARLAEGKWWHSFELPDGTQINGVCDLQGLKGRIAQFPIPEDLRGKRVLDIGAWDGWFSFEMERRGAEVLAIDNWDNPLFRKMHALLGSRVEYRQLDMYELTPERIGRFDIVLFMGVLYHLKHPLLALERVCALTTDMAAVDSFVLREQHRPGENVEQRPVMEFYETDEFGGQTDNWVGPSVPCLLAFCRTAGFARVELQSVIAHSACIACYRSWGPAKSAKAGPPVLHAAHNTDYGMNFNSQRDEYVTAWFEWTGPALGIADVQPEAGGYGVKPIHVAPYMDGQYQVNFKLPPGLTPGWHDVRVRVQGSQPGAPKPIAVDMPLESAVLEITGVCDGTTWEKDELNLSRGQTISVWVRGLPANADANNLHIVLDGTRLRVAYIEASTEGPRQVNAEGRIEGGARDALLLVRIGSSESAPTVVRITL